jgi:serum/glucocorticoid-regulated kinase 2
MCWPLSHRAGDDHSWECHPLGTGVDVPLWLLIAGGAALVVALVVWRVCAARARRRGELGGCCGCCCCSASQGARHHQPGRGDELPLGQPFLGSGSRAGGPYSSAVKTGFLHKQGHVVRNWKRRFFVLESTVLLYYESPTDIHPKGQILLDGTTLMLGSAHVGKVHSFGIFHPARDTYFLAAMSEQEMMVWVRLLRRDSSKVGLVDFEPITKLGEGNFGKVILVRKKSTDPTKEAQLFAMKVLSKAAIMHGPDGELPMAEHGERRILQKVSHPFMVKLHFAFQTSLKLFLVMDFVCGGDLYVHLKRMKSFPESIIKVFTAELVLALEYLHKLKIVYRDLKPENILVDQEGHLRVADFGLSKEQPADDIPLATFCGTPYYIAPEMLAAGAMLSPSRVASLVDWSFLTGIALRLVVTQLRSRVTDRRVERQYTEAVDWWALGVLCYELLVGKPPFHSDSVETLYAMIRTADIAYPQHVSRGARELIDGFLRRNVQSRFGSNARDVGAVDARIKDHQFFGFDELQWVAVFHRRVPTGFRLDMECTGTHQYEAAFTRKRAIDSFEQPVFRNGVGQIPGFSFSRTPASSMQSTQGSTGVPPRAPSTASSVAHVSTQPHVTHPSGHVCGAVLRDS